MSKASNNMLSPSIPTIRIWNGRKGRRSMRVTIWSALGIGLEDAFDILPPLTLASLQPVHPANQTRPFLGPTLPSPADYRDLTAFLYQRDRDYCIGMISSRWAANGANVCGAGRSVVEC